MNVAATDQIWGLEDQILNEVWSSALTQAIIEGKNETKGKLSRGPDLGKVG